MDLCQPYYSPHAGCLNINNETLKSTPEVTLIERVAVTSEQIEGCL